MIRSLDCVTFDVRITHAHMIEPVSTWYGIRSIFLLFLLFSFFCFWNSKLAIRMKSLHTCECAWECLCEFRITYEKCEKYGRVMSCHVVSNQINLNLFWNVCKDMSTHRAPVHSLWKMERLTLFHCGYWCCCCCCFSAEWARARSLVAILKFVLISFIRLWSFTSSFLFFFIRCVRARHNFLSLWLFVYLLACFALLSHRSLEMMMITRCVVINKLV